jgi:hypothetical protein
VVKIWQRYHKNLMHFVYKLNILPWSVRSRTKTTAFHTLLHLFKSFGLQNFSISNTHHPNPMLNFETILGLVNMIYWEFFWPNIGRLIQPTTANFCKFWIYCCGGHKFAPPLLRDKPVAETSGVPATASFHHVGKFGRVYEWRVSISARHCCHNCSDGLLFLPATASFLK